MSLLRTRARVLRTWPLGETSLIVLLLTEDDGTRRAVAKGARGIKSHFRGLLEPGTPVEAVLYLKRRSDLHLLKEISLAGTLPGSSRSLQTLALRLAGIELIILCHREEANHDGLFDLLDEYLRIFDSGEEVGFAPLFAFEAALLALNGLLPELDTCCITDKPLTDDNFRFLPVEALFARADCGHEGIDLERGDRDWLQSLFRTSPSGMRDRLMPDGVRKRIGRVLHIALSHHLPGYRLPRALAMLRKDESPGGQIDKESSA
ncbi:MAG: DNA repair protein RecO [bacterium]|nr:DNA repair protein RecO [bacterium]